MKYVSCFSGIEAASVASQGLGWEPVAFSEIDNFASAVLAHHYPKVPNLGDITKIDWSEYNGRVGLVCGGSPCFTAGHLVLTERGHVPIESVHVGDVVLTHKGNWKRVVRVGGKVAPAFILKGQGHWGIECTDTHPFWAVEKTGKSTHIQGKAVRVVSIGDPSWVKAKEMRGRFWTSHTDYGKAAMPLPMCEGRETALKLSASQLAFIAGLYLGDGYLRHNTTKNAHVIMLGVNDQKRATIEETLPGLFSIAERVGKAVKLRKCSSALYRWLDSNFGQLSVSKELPSWVYQMPEDLRREMLRGYILTDGTPIPNGHRTSTVSKKLAIGIKTLAVSLGYSCACRFVKNKRTECVIEGRTVNERPYYTVSISDKSSSAFHKNTLFCGLVRSVIPTGEEKQVYNIEVEDDHSYTIDGIIVKNCQAFSVAGLRLSLGDPRGNLTLEYMRAVHAIKPKWVVWEQVPGVFSASGNPFGCFVAGLAGYDTPIEPPNGKWGNSGFLVAKDEGSYSLAWRILDAQHFGVPQRRRRIFLVGHLGIGCWWKPLEVLLERHREGGDIAQGRKAREEAAEDAGRGVEVIGFAQNTRDEVRLQNGDGKLSGALAAQPGMKQTTYLAIRTNQTGANGLGVAEGVAEGVMHTLDCSNGQAVGYMKTVGALCARDYKGVGSQYVQEGKDLALPMVMAHGQGGAEIREGQSPCLTCNHEAPIFFAPRSPDGHARVMDGVCETLNTAQGGQRTPCVAFTWQGGTESRTSDDMAGTLTKSQTEAICLLEDQGGSVNHATENPKCVGTLRRETHGHEPILAFAQNQEGELRTSETMGTLGTTQNASGRATGKVMQGYTVRRITPMECERLQGFPDSWTQIPYRGKSAELCPDGPRYKALGNSWAVPVARWVFERIDKVDKL